jgi:hypothetical protein
MIIRTNLSGCNPVLSFFRVIEERQKAQGKGLVLLPFDIITSLQVVPPVVQEIGVDSVSVYGSNSNEVVEDDGLGLDSDLATLAGSSNKQKTRELGQLKSARIWTGVNGEGDV